MNGLTYYTKCDGSFKSGLLETAGQKDDHNDDGSWEKVQKDLTENIPSERDGEHDLVLRVLPDHVDVLHVVLRHVLGPGVGEVGDLQVDQVPVGGGAEGEGAGVGVKGKHGHVELAEEGLVVVPGQAEAGPAAGVEEHVVEDVLGAPHTGRLLPAASSDHHNNLAVCTYLTLMWDRSSLTVENLARCRRMRRRAARCESARRNSSG